MMINRGSVVHTQTRLWAGWSAIRFPLGVRDFFFRQNVQTGETDHMVSRLKISGAIPLLP